MNTAILAATLSGCAVFLASPAMAQDVAEDAPVNPAPETTAQAGPPQGPGQRPPMGENVFDDTWVTVGLGGAYSPSYTGSDDYVFSALPLVQGKIAGVSFQPRGPGLAFDLIDDDVRGPQRAGVSYAFGPSFRLRSDRANRIKDPVVLAAGELDRAFELGVAGGVSFPGLISPVDSLSLTVDTRWDVAGAHDGAVVEPSISYFTPLNRGMAASLSVSATYGDDDFNSYYYTVSPAQSLASGLPVYQADSGINRVGTNLLFVYDFDGNALNGGLSAVVIGSYSRLTGHAQDTPYTSIRGSADQFFAAVAIGYTF